MAYDNQSHKDAPSLVQAICNEQVMLSKSYQIVTWATIVRDMLNSCLMGRMWLNQHMRNERLFQEEFRQRLLDMSLQSWTGDVGDTSSYRLSKHVKTYLVYEYYLDLENVLTSLIKRAR